MKKSQNEGEAKLVKDSTEAFKKLRAQAEENIKKAQAEFNEAVEAEKAKKDELWTHTALHLYANLVLTHSSDDRVFEPSYDSKLWKLTSFCEFTW